MLTGYRTSTNQTWKMIQICGPKKLGGIGDVHACVVLEVNQLINDAYTWHMAGSPLEIWGLGVGG